MEYADLSANKKAFIFELDDVLFPVKDYDLQIYYLFANFLEYQETFPPALDVIAFMKAAYENHGAENIFEKTMQMYGFNEKYRENFNRLQLEAKLPLKLLLYNNMLTLLQEIIVNRKQIFIITAGIPKKQLNKIKQMEWNGMEPYLKVYFTDEINTNEDVDVLQLLTQQNDLSVTDLLMVGLNEQNSIFSQNTSVDFMSVSSFINNN